MARKIVKKYRLHGSFSKFLQLTIKRPLPSLRLVHFYNTGLKEGGCIVKRGKDRNLLVSFGPISLGFPLIKRQSLMHIVKLNPCAFFANGQVQKCIESKIWPILFAAAWSNLSANLFVLC